MDTRSCRIVLLLCGLPLLAHGQAASVHIRARVLSNVDVRLVHPAELRITAADVQRGYVDAAGPVFLVIGTNTPAPVVLAFAPASEVVRRTRIAGLGGVLELGPGGGLLALRDAATAAGVGLQIRFFLAPGANPGAYPWPIRVSPAS